MEYIASILQSLNNNIPAVVIIIIILFSLFIGVKKGYINFQKGGLKIGEDNISNHSRIKQLQWDVVQAETEIALRSLPKEYLEEPKKWRTHYVVGKYRDVLEQAIILNNIVDDDEYIESKQILAYSEILKATQDDYFRSDGFQKYINELTKKIVKQFVKIKERYDKT